MKMPNTFWILVIVVLVFAIIPSASAYDWDNVKSYDSNIREITIKSAFGLPLISQDVAKIKLLSDLNVHVGAGYQKVAEFEINSYQDYDNAIKSLELYNLIDNNKAITRTIDYKYKTYENIKVDDYSVTCEYTEEFTEYGSRKQICNKQIIGNHIETKEVWKDLDSMSMKEEKIIIGLFTDVKVNDNIEWIPTLYGARIDEWAIWSYDLNTNLNAYYNFDETSGTAALDSIGLNNGTITGATINKGYGKLGKTYYYDGSNDKVTLGANVSLNIVGNLSLAGWFLINKTGVTNSMAGKWEWDAAPNNRSWFLMVNSANKPLFYISPDGTDPNTKTVKATTAFSQNTWYHVAAVYNGTTINMYVNGVLENITAYSSGIFNNKGTEAELGVQSDSHDYLNGSIDELGIWNRTLTQAEITQLYNGGTGMTYTSITYPTVSINSPVNAYNSTSQSITFNCTASDAIHIQNVTLYINNTLNETNTSGINNTAYIFSKTMAEGFYNWTCESCNNLTTPLCTNATSRNLTINTGPQINVSSPVYNMTNYSTSTIYINASTSLAVDLWKFNINGTNYTLTDINTSITASDGLYRLLLYGRNSASGVYGLNDSVYFRVDTSAPTISITSTNGTAVYDTNLTINYTIADSGIGISACWASLSGVNTTFNCTSSWDFVNVTSLGNNTIYIWANDTLGNTMVNSSTFYMYPSLFECNSTYSMGTLNFSTIDEANISHYVNETDFRGTFIISPSSDLTYNRSFSYEIDNNPLSNFTFCIYPNWSEAYANAFIEYGGADYMPKNYLLLAAPINNASQQINLYVLNSSIGQNLIVKVLDSDLVAEPDITVQMQRYFPATNTWMQVGMGVSDSLGQVVMQVVPLTVDYKFILSNSTGDVVYTTSSMKIVCYATPCTINLVIPSTTASNIYQYYQGISGLSYSLTYNSSNSIVTMTWADTTGLTQQMRLNVQKINMTRNQTICNNISLVSASGTMTCNLTNTSGTYLAQTFRVASPENRLQTLIVEIGRNFAVFGDEGMFWTIIFFITLVLIGTWNPVVSIVLGMFAIVPIVLFGMAAMGYAVIVTIVILGAIVVSQLKT